MKIKLKPKSFGPVYVKVGEDGNLKFGETLEQAGQVSPDISSPAISLLYSLGSCIAISLQMAATSRKVTLQPFYVKVRSAKAEDLPNRFENFKVSVDSRFIDDKELAKELLAKAKSLCTVSNTFNTKVELTLESRTSSN